jgi:hypothetical protein
VGGVAAGTAGAAGTLLLWWLIADRSWRWEALWILLAALAVAAAQAATRGRDAEEYATVVALILGLVWVCAASTAWATYEIREWSRSPTSVAATVTDCRDAGTVVDPNSGASYDQYDCLYHWTAGGAAHTQRRSANHLYADGHAAHVNVDRSGDAHSHDVVAIVFALVIAVGSGGLLMFGAGWAVVEFREERRNRQSEAARRARDQERADRSA